MDQTGEMNQTDEMDQTGEMYQTGEYEVIYTYNNVNYNIITTQDIHDKLLNSR